MSEHIAQAQLTKVAAVSDAPARTRVDRTFGLPSGLYAGTVAAYLGFLAIMGALFMNGELVIPMVAFVGIVIAGFGVAGKWSTMKPDNPSAPLSWGQFSNRGIQTLSGPLTAGEASIQVLILPVLILFWGVCIAVIVSLT